MTTRRGRAKTIRTTHEGVTYKIANCREEREDAFRLIHDVYVESGLMPANATGMRITPFHILPTTDLLVAYHGSNLVYTMTLVGDDQLGMPLEAVYPEEIESRRSLTNLYFGEVSCLASHRGYFPRARMFDVFVHLAGLLVQSARENGIDRLFIACHPKHARFYQSFLGFKQIGEERMYSPTLGKPAVACEHDFATLDVDKYKLYDRIYAPPYTNLELFHQPMLQGDRNYFSDSTEFNDQHFPLEAVT